MKDRKLIWYMGVGFVVFLVVWLSLRWAMTS